jgi:hypothetical protein
MKRALIAIATLAMVGASVPRLQAGSQVVHVYSAPPVYVQTAPVVRQVVVQQPTVVYTQPAPVVRQVVVQQPVVYQPAPVIYQPAPVVYPAPVFVAPRPYYRHHHHHYRHHHHRPSFGFHISFGH